MSTVIMDCYTDEPSGLGVPPYLGTYPRYIAGLFDDVIYLTIDDLRLWKFYDGIVKETRESQKTNIKIYNLTKNKDNVKEILENAEKIIIIAGVHTPGKYLSALPGTLSEISELLKDVSAEKILTGPAVFGTSLEGGRFFERNKLETFKVKNFDFSFEEIKDLSVKGIKILNQIPDLRIIEIETGRGCSRAKHCSFCTEPIKHRIEFRNKDDVVDEVKHLYNAGVRHFRLGKQSCYYSHPEAVEILRDIRKSCPDLETLHIDNVNPANVLSKRGEEITEAIVKYCTPGNIAAFGVESFDKDVAEANNLNCTPEMAYDAVKLINKYGAERGSNGMPKFLPGINILFGLINESKKTNDENMFWLRKILDSNLLVRRINIRQVNIFEGTQLFDTVGNKFLRKNKKFYWKWRNDIRQNIDSPMLKKLVPEGTILKNVRTEIYDGKTTFARQIGTYPLIVGIKGRIPLNKFVNVKVTGYMLRSIVGEVI